MQLKHNAAIVYLQIIWATLKLDALKEGGAESYEDTLGLTNNYSLARTCL